MAQKPSKFWYVLAIFAIIIGDFVWLQASVLLGVGFLLLGLNNPVFPFELLTKIGIAFVIVIPPVLSGFMAFLATRSKKVSFVWASFTVFILIAEFIWYTAFRGIKI